ncbi:MAG TPA: hypothetical protein VGX25_24640 [Actinophytocola sp.]|uniref:hypothetical protein n=1 Tax=Actinophytocola sp. TaxID=1872138 RepID=UPI002DDDBAE8|nr:hypothetical protein [Actinophytocola sp.]HEV2782594.1 hypothetical protein [Actinophytocola sp.]
MTTGARRGELCALRWNDIDFAPGEETTWIARAIKKSKKKGWVEGPTKTHQQRRVALDPETVLVLGDLRERVKVRAKALGADLAEDAFVFLRLRTAAPSTARPRSHSGTTVWPVG